MLLKNFYNHFHSSAKVQTKIISTNNFTYFLILQRLNKILKDKKRIQILNYGCGVGTIDLYLAKQGHSIQGYDVSTKAIQIANKNSLILNLRKQAHFFLLRSKTLNKIKMKFDLIICSEVLEHINKDLQLLIKLNKLLKNSGKIFVSVPSKSSPLFRLGFTKKFDKKVGHIRRYSSKDIQSNLIKAGFRVLEIYKTEGILRNALFVFHPLNKFIKYLKGPLSLFVNYFDMLTVLLFGESDIIILARKI